MERDGDPVILGGGGDLFWDYMHAYIHTIIRPIGITLANLGLSTDLGAEFVNKYRMLVPRRYYRRYYRMGGNLLCRTSHLQQIETVGRGVSVRLALFVFFG